VKISKKIISLIGVITFSFSSVAADLSCGDHFVGKAPPNVSAVVNHERNLCFAEFAIGYSMLSRSPLYSAEHLTALEVRQAKLIDRNDQFHEESSLPDNARAELRDYRGSGFDRGHLAPSADMPTESSQFESFSLANMVPQLHANNAGIWSRIESSVRAVAVRYGDVYLVTGGIYESSHQKINGRIPVPNALFKSLYVPSLGAAAVFVVDNDTSGIYRVISVDELNLLTGIDVYPSLPQEIKSTVTVFPVFGNK